MIKRILPVLLALLLIVGFSYFVAPLARAEISNCTASVSPHTVEKNTSGAQFSFTVTNSDSVDYNRVRITRPDEALWTVVGGSSDGWSVDWDENDITFSLSAIPSSSSDDFSVTANVADFTFDSTAWTVEVSEDDGGTYVACSGSLGTTIIDSEAVIDGYALISDITLSNLSSSSVTVSWTTDEAATSIVEYGLTDEFGSTESNETMTTFHSLVIDGLSASTTYHYNIKSEDSGGNISEAGDATFLTAIAGTTTTTTITVTTTTTRTITPTPTPTPAPDRTVPWVSIQTSFEKPFEKAPLITGTASDNKDINSIDYSVDEGKNWLPVDTINNIGAKTTAFSFLPAIFEDGNYKLKIRAKDSAGNTGQSSVQTLVIDRLPPQIGGAMYSLGPQVLVPNKSGIIFSLAKIKTKITVSAVGGPTEINILAGEKKFTLTRNRESGLWSTELDFEKPGNYELIVKSIDGAGNKTERPLNRIEIIDSGKIVSGSSIVTSGEIVLWYFDSQTSRFVVWDGASYGQTNPQKITKEGEYGFFAPHGKYYLEIKSYGYKTVRTRIFDLDVSMPIAVKFNLEKSPQIHLGPITLALPDFFASIRNISINFPVASSEVISAGSSIGKDLPNIDIYLEDKKIQTVTFRGKPTILTFLSTWTPYVSEQLKFLDELSSENSEINIIPVISQETVASTIVFGKRGAYSFPIYSDPDGLLIKPLNLSFLPTSVFVDRKGIVRKISVGIMTKEEILNSLVN